MAVQIVSHYPPEKKGQLDKDLPFIYGTRPILRGNKKEESYALEYEIHLFQNEISVMQFSIGIAIKETTGGFPTDADLAEGFVSLANGLSLFVESVLLNEYEVDATIERTDLTSMIGKIALLKGSLN